MLVMRNLNLISIQSWTYLYVQALTTCTSNEATIAQHMKFTDHSKSLLQRTVLLLMVYMYYIITLSKYIHGSNQLNLMDLQLLFVIRCIKSWHQFSLCNKEFMDLKRAWFRGTGPILKLPRNPKKPF